MDSLLEHDDLRFVFVGGKGGVGKTTTSSGIATALAKSGKRVLLVSTDPAHSLGDAWRRSFGNDPTKVADDLNLSIMEVDPRDSMKEELKSWTALAARFETTTNSSSSSSSESAKGEENDEEAMDVDDDDLSHKIRSFQEWLSGIPGIDEATALSSAISHIESGEYDIIVFDTAPTGHTVKLLQLPAILQAGLDKLESWGTTIYSYWETLRGAFSSTEEGNRLTASTKKEITDKLRKYRAGIQRVGKMLTDGDRTRFAVVCIAEFLSISETKRLLQELDRCKVRASHVVVNQLVKEDAHLSEKEMAKIEKWANTPGMSNAMRVVANKARNACRLTSSRRVIQSRYITELKSYDEVKGRGLTVVEVPLLPEEVTGKAAIENFSRLLMSKELDHVKAPATKVQRVLYEGDVDDSTGAGDDVPHKVNNPLTDKIKGLLDDPEIKALIEKSPKAQAAVEDLQKNPMSVMTHMADPELQPLVQAAMKKLF